MRYTTRHIVEHVVRNILKFSDISDDNEIYYTLQLIHTEDLDRLQTVRGLINLTTVSEPTFQEITLHCIILHYITLHVH